MGTPGILALAGLPAVPSTDKGGTQTLGSLPQVDLLPIAPYDDDDQVPVEAVDLTLAGSPSPQPLVEAHKKAETASGLDSDLVHPDLSLSCIDEGHQDGYEDGCAVAKDCAKDAAIRLVSSSITVNLPLSTLVNPRSLSANFESPFPIVHERAALAIFLEAFPRDLSAEDDFIDFELSDFTVYIDSDLHRNTLRPLHHLSNKMGATRMYFDGVLSIGELRRYVVKVPFDELPIGNYGTADATVGDQIWIRSEFNAKRRKEIYYRLKKPSVEYARYYETFLWVADLGKHFVDFCEWMLERGRPVAIHHFKSNFGKWLYKTHRTSPSFRQWYKKLGRDDFRSSVVASKDFLFKEAAGVLKGRARSLRIFREIDGFTQYKNMTVPTLQEIPPTVVTPYIYECFGHMAIGDVLERIQPTTTARDPNPRKDKKRRTTPLEYASYNEMIDAVAPGTVISTKRDEEECGSKWRTEHAQGSAEDDRWYALVQKVSNIRHGKVFDVTWLYRPVDTPCGQMKYPWQNELFLSNHCTCDEGKDSNIHHDEVLAIHEVEWFGEPGTSAEFFIRQVYQNEDRQWVTLKEEHLACAHNKPETCVFAAGDTVLAALAPGKPAQPFEVAETFFDNEKKFASLWRFLRRREVDEAARNSAPNELVYTEQLITVEASKIIGRCFVRIFQHGRPIPTPYDRGGIGNAFFITHKQVIREGKLVYEPFAPEDPEPTLRQGFHPKQAPQKAKLRGLDLFCGCGNLGRGLEDGGAIEMRWANDIWGRAIHTYMANVESPDKVHPFLGPVEDLLRCALQGKFSDSVPSPDEVDFIAGGSPCPGFSLLTVDKSTPKQAKNRSLVAAFAAFVDFYRPKYGILENVVNIVQNKGLARSQDLFSQLICAVVGLGYQVGIVLGNSWEHGAAQSRPRIFLVFAAAGLRLPSAPRPTHSPPNSVEAWKRKSVGKLANNEPWVTNVNDPTVFHYVSAKEATADLPDIGDGQADVCIAFPDHRLAAGLTKENRLQISNIPTQPCGMNFAKAWNEGKGVMTEAERACFPEKGSRVTPISRAWGRVNPHDSFSTVTTTCSYQDSRTGRALHWQQPRPLTVMEARRAQGLPDHEVLLGRPQDQWRMIGNAVPRQIAMALGLCLREAWFGSLYQDGDESQGDAPADVPVPGAEDVKSATIPIGDGSDPDDSGIPILTLDDSDREHTEQPTRASSSDPMGLPALYRETETPATSVSENNEANTDSSATRKRPLLQIMSIELISKKPRIE